MKKPSARIILILLVFALIMLSGTISACADDTIIVAVTSIDIDTMPDQQYFLVGAELDIDDTVLYVTYENGVSRTVTLAELKQDVKITGYDNTTRKLNQTVTLTYRDKSVSLVIDVVNEEDILKMTFDANNGTLAGAPHTAIADKPLSAYISEASLTPTYDGYVFAGWYTSSDKGATLDRRVDFSTDTFSQNTVFYAKWQVAVVFHLASYTQDNVYEITSSYTAYVDKGGSLTEKDFNSYVDNRLVFKDKTGYKRAFKSSEITVAGMNRDDVIKLADASYGEGYSNITETKTVYCCYVPELVKIRFDFNGGDATWDPQNGFSILEEEDAAQSLYYTEIPYGTKYVFGDAGKRADVGDDAYTFVFGGWYVSETYTDANKVPTTKVTGGYSSFLYATEPITADVTFYARWQWELRLVAGVLGAFDEYSPLQTLTFDEHQQIYYHDLPETPVTFLTSNSEQPITYSKERYTSWWALEPNRYTDASESRFVEYEYALDPARAYGLADFLSDTFNTGVIYANYYRIPYYVTFNTYNNVEQSDSVIINGDIKYYGDTLSSYSGANGSSEVFEGWYTDKQLRNKLVPSETKVDGVRYGRSQAYLTDGKGLIILNSTSYYVEKTAGDGSNIYTHNPVYLEEDVKQSYLVGTLSADGRFSIDGVKYYTTAGTIYVQKADGEVEVAGEKYTIKADFDEDKAYAQSSYAIMDMHAAYTVDVYFRISSSYPGADAFNTKEEASIKIRKEYYADGIYYADVSKLKPALPVQTGLDGYWLNGSVQGVVDPDCYDPDTQIPTKYPEFDKITASVSFAAHYITQQFEVTYILNNQYNDGDTYGFNTVYLAAKDTADWTDSTTIKVTYNQKASFYKQDAVIEEGDITTGKVRWEIEGWYTEPDYLSKFNFDNTAIITTYTLYAKWVRVGTVGLQYRLMSDGNYTVDGFDAALFEAEYGSGASLVRLVVPDYYNAKHVTQISARVFKDNTTLKEIFVAHSVVKIDAEAFYNATNLEKLNTFNQNIQLDDNVFGATKWYTTAKAAAQDGMLIFNGNQLYEYFGTASQVVITEESGIRIIGYSAFINNKTMTSISITNAVSAIRGYAFAYCTNLEHIEFLPSERYANSQLAASGIGDSAFLQLESLQNISVRGDNYATIDGVLYRREGGNYVELVLYPTCKPGTILVLPKTLTAVGKDAFYSNPDNTSTHKIALQAIVFDSVTAPTLVAGEYAFSNLPNLKYILVSESPTYRGEDYHEAWLAIYNNADYRDKFRYNNIAIDYRSDGIPMTNLPDKTVFVYGDEAEDYVPTTSNAATFVGWFVDAELTDRWTGSLEDWLVVWDILAEDSWDVDGHTTLALTVYAKWEVAINTGSSYAGTVYVVGGKPVTDDRIVLTIDGVKYYARYTEDGDVVFDDQAPSGTFVIDKDAKTITRIITSTTETLTYTFGRIAISVAGKTYYITKSGDKLSGMPSTGEWTIDESAQVITRTMDGVVTKFSYSRKPIRVVVDKAAYYASYDAQGVVTFEGSAPVGTFVMDVTTGVLTRTISEQEVYSYGNKTVIIDGNKSNISVEDRSYTIGVSVSKHYLTADGGIIVFEGSAPSGAWSISGTTMTRTIGSASINYTVSAGHIRFSLDNVTYYAQLLGGAINDTLGNVVFDGAKPDGVFNVDPTTGELKRTVGDVTTTLIYSRGYYLLYVESVTFEDSAPEGTWLIDVNNNTLIRLIGNNRIDYLYNTYTDGNTPIYFVDGGERYYAMASSDGILHYSGNGMVPAGSYMAIPELYLVGTKVAHTLGVTMTIDGTAYFATIDGGVVAFSGATPAGSWSVDTASKTLTDGSAIYPYINAVLIDGRIATYDEQGYLTFVGEVAPSKAYHYGIAGDYVIELVAESGFGQFVLPLQYVDLSANNTAGVWSIDTVSKTVTLTTATGTMTYAYVEEPILIASDGTRVGNVNVYTYLSSVVAQRENVEEGYTTAWFYLDGTRVTDDYVDLAMVTLGGNVTVDRRINVYSVTYKYYDYNTASYKYYDPETETWVADAVSGTAEHFSTLLRPVNPVHGDITGVELVFGGWYLDEECRVNRWQDNAEVTGDVVLYARWTVRVATKYIFDGEEKDSLDVLALYNSTMTAPQAPNKPGYSYKWYVKNGDVFEAFDFSTAITQSYTLYAMYEELSYTIHFVSADGTVAPEDQTVVYGNYAEYKEPENKTLNNYVFVGWYLDQEYTRAFGFASTPIEADTTLYAYWVYTTTTSLLFNVVNNSGTTATYSVMGKTVQDAVVYIPEKQYVSVNTYPIYKDGNLLDGSKYEVANNSMTIIDEALNTWTQASLFYKGTDGKVYTSMSLDATTATGTYTQTADALSVTITKDGQSFSYTIDLTQPKPEIVANERSQVTTIESNAFENNDKVTHIVISKYVREIRDNAFKGMTKLARFTVLSDGNVYYDVNGRQLVNCNGYFASIDGVLYAVSTSMKVRYLDGYKVSIDRLIKMPPMAVMPNANYVVEQLKFSVDNGNILLDGAGPSIDAYAMERLEYIDRISFEATTRPTLGAYAFSSIKTDVKIFVNNKQGFIYTDGSRETAWYEWRDYLYPNEITITYVHTMTGATLFTDKVAVFSTATDRTYTDQYIVETDGRRWVWSFGGWMTAADMVQPFDFYQELEDDVTLYARWVLNASSGLQFDKIIYSGEEAYMVSYVDTNNVNIVIPNFYMGLPVRKIGFFRSDKIESLYIPATVVDIPETSLLNMSALSTIIVDERSTFFKVVDGVLYSYDGEDLVLYPAKLARDSKEYTVLDGTVNVKRGAFFGTSLEKITFPESVTSIGQALFGNTPSLERIIFLGTTPPTLRANPFVGASSSLLILVPGITNDVSIVDLYKAKWEDMTEIGYRDNIYAKTVYLRLMVEKDNVWTVFSSPSTEYASAVGAQNYYPTAAGKVFVGWYTTEYTGGRVWDFVNDKLYQDTKVYARWNQSTGADENGTPYLTYTNGKVTLNRDAVGALDLDKIVIASHYVYDNKEYTVDTIDVGAFRDMTKLKTVVVPSTVKNILADAFSGCTSLVDISLPSSILLIAEGAFSNCTSLEYIVIPSAVGTISDRLFAGCVSLKEVVFSGSPKGIGEYAFSNCIALQNIDIKGEVTTIGNYAFNGATSLQSIVLPDTLKVLGNYVFYGCENLESVIFSTGMLLDTWMDDQGNEQRSLGEGLFYNCYRLDNIVLPEGLTTISQMVFYFNTSLSHIVIPATITSIGVRAFYQCVSLETVTIEEGSQLVTIAASSFANCSSLKQIEFKTDARMTFGQNAFTGCVSLEQVIVHSTYVAIINGTDETQMFLAGASKATLYVDANLVSTYKTQVEAYKDRIKPYLSKVEYYIDKNTRYQYLDSVTGVTPYVFENLTDNVIADEYVLDAPVVVNSAATWGWDKTGMTFGGWGYYKNAGDVTLSIYNFATETVGAEGIKLYAIWIVDSTDGLAYTLTYDGTIQVSKGNLSTETEVVIGNYYKYNNVYLPVTRIQSGLIAGTSVVSVKIPETITYIADDAFASCSTLERFSISSANTAYTVVDEVLYTKDQKKIVCYPPSKGARYGSVVFNVPIDTTTITPYTFENAKYIAQFNNSSPYFAVREQVLYTADMKSLVAYPALRGNTSYTLPKEVTNIYVNALTMSENSSLSSISVEEGNSYYFAEDGVLYRTITSTTAELVRFPVAKTGDNVTGKYELDTTKVVRISTNAFRYARYLTAVVVDTTSAPVVASKAFDNMGNNAYILVPTDSVYSYKVTTGWVNYSDRILPIKSVVTFDPNNGEEGVTQEVDTLAVYPTYPYDTPRLPYSTSSDWFYRDAEGNQIMVELGSADYLVFGDVTLTLEWMVKETDEIKEQGLQFVLQNGGYIVNKGSATTDENNQIIIIPSEHQGLPVIGIADRGFMVERDSDGNIVGDSAMQYLRTIVIPETVTSIGDDAFTGCWMLTDMVLLTMEAPSVSSKAMLSGWRSDVYDYDSRNPMCYFVRRDAFSAFDNDSDWPNAIRTFSLPIYILDEQNGTLIDSYVRYKLYDSDNVINPTLSHIDTYKEGYTFEGWFYTTAGVEYEYTVAGQVLDIETVRGSGIADFSLTIYAKYTPDTITLTFVDTQGSMTEQQIDSSTGDLIPVTRTGLTASAVTAPETVLAGAELLGWTEVLDGGALGEYVDLSNGMPTRDMTLQAVWRYYSDITFETADGTLVESARYYRGDTLPTPEKEGYDFLGWVTELDDGGNPVGTPTLEVTEDFSATQTIYAVWQEKEVE